MMGSAKIKVASLPSELDSNPYIRILYGGLDEKGVELVPCGKLTFSWLIKNGRDIDILHIHWPETHYIFDSFMFSVMKLKYFFALIVFAKMLGCKVVWTSHNILGHEKKHPGLDLLGKKFLVRLADAVISHTDYAADIVKKKLGWKKEVFVIPHPNYISYYKNKSSRNSSRERLSFPENAKVCLLFGSIRRYKGIPDLIDAFENLDDDMYLLIAGRPVDDALSEDISRRAGANPAVRAFFGFIDRDDVQYYFNAADFVVLPYKDIVTSGALILAMSFGRPVIAPDIGCFSEILDGDTGLLYNPDKEGALAEAIRRSAGCDSKHMGERCYVKALEFDPKKVADSHLKVYEKLSRR